MAEPLKNRMRQYIQEVEGRNRKAWEGFKSTCDQHEASRLESIIARQEQMLAIGRDAIARSGVPTEIIKRELQFKVDYYVRLLASLEEE